MLRAAIGYLMLIFVPVDALAEMDRPKDRTSAAAVGGLKAALFKNRGKGALMTLAAAL